MSLADLHAVRPPATPHWPGAPFYWRQHQLIWGLIAALAVIDAVWLAFFTDLRIDRAALFGRLAVAGAVFLLAAFYRWRGRSQRICATLLSVAELLALMIFATLLSYLAIRLGFPMADDTLARWSAVFGVDWPAMAQWVGSRRWLSVPLFVLYASSLPQILIVVIAVGFSGQFKALLEFTAVLSLTSVVSVLIGAVLPALGAHHFYGLPDHGAAAFIPAIQAAHDGTLQVLDIGKAEGLVVFPSYHTVISLALIAACWPLRRLRWPVLVLNLALIAGVPLWGSHYLIDVAAGFGLWLLVASFWRRCAPRN